MEVEAIATLMNPGSSDLVPDVSLSKRVMSNWESAQWYFKIHHIHKDKSGEKSKEARAASRDTFEMVVQWLVRVDHEKAKNQLYFRQLDLTSN